MNKETAAFIRHHADDDVRKLALSGTKPEGVDLPFALDQIAGRQAARRKLPSWAACEGIVFPPHLSMEQCSSEQTARYKASVVGQGQRMVDLTGGFGVDFSFLARGFREAVYVERLDSLCEIARENFRILDLQHAEVVCADSADYLRSMPPADLIYIDPARRDRNGLRTFAISDCSPDIIALRELLLAKARHTLIKLSPMLDWRKAVSDIGEAFVREVHIVSVGNECKELLIHVQPQDGEAPSGAAGGASQGGIPIYCVNDDSVFVALCGGPAKPPLPFPSSQDYLYEPNASIMKAGCFDEVAQHFRVRQLSQNSHLFVSSQPVKDFPGRSFQIDAVTSMNKQELKQHLKGISQANVTVRNFPMSVAELRRRLKISEGSSTYIFATTLATGEHRLYVCRKA